MLLSSLRLVVILCLYNSTEKPSVFWQTFYSNKKRPVSLLIFSSSFYLATSYSHRGKPPTTIGAESLTSVFEYRLAISGESPRQLVRSDPHVPTAHIPVFSLCASLIFLLLPSLRLVVILCLYNSTEKPSVFWQSFYTNKKDQYLY